MTVRQPDEALLMAIPRRCLNTPCYLLMCLSPRGMITAMILASSPARQLSNTTYFTMASDP